MSGIWWCWSWSQLTNEDELGSLSKEREARVDHRRSSWGFHQSDTMHCNDDDGDGGENTTSLRQLWSHHILVLIGSWQDVLVCGKVQSAHFSVVFFCRRMFCSSASADPTASFTLVYLLFWSLPKDGSFVVNVRLNFETNDFSFLSVNVTFNALQCVQICQFIVTNVSNKFSI